MQTKTTYRYVNYILFRQHEIMLNNQWAITSAKQVTFGPTREEAGIPVPTESELRLAEVLRQLPTDPCIQRAVMDLCGGVSNEYFDLIRTTKPDQTRALCQRLIELSGGETCE